jgi:dolichol-phosphate mannosyltransferase
MAKISIVVPVYFNESNLPDLFRALQGLEKEIDLELEFVFVDDGSEDGSWNLLQDFVATEPRARAVKLSRNFGANAATFAGFVHARGDVAVNIAADLQDPPEMIPEMVRLWREGFHVVLAVRENRDEALWIRLTADLYYRMIRRWVIPQMPIGGFSFSLVDRKVIDVLIHSIEKNSALNSLIVWTGFRQTSILYRRRARKKGSNTWTLLRRIKYFIDSFVAFSFFPIRIMQLVGLLTALLGFLYAANIAFYRIIFSQPVPGWSALMIVVLTLGGVQLLMLGMIGEYQWRNLDEVKRRPPFIVETVVEGGPP